MQDTAIAHTANQMLLALNEMTGEQVTIQWPSSSPDFNPCDFYLDCMLQDKIHVNNSHSRIQKKYIQQVNSNTSEEVLHQILQNLIMRWEGCLQAQGYPFQCPL
jgi:hypothetical protein